MTKRDKEVFNKALIKFAIENKERLMEFFNNPFTKLFLKIGDDNIEHEKETILYTFIEGE